MNKQSNFSPEEIQEMEEELIQRGIIAPSKLEKEELREQIMKVLVTEGKDSELGRQAWLYCKSVDFEYEAIKPILESDPGFLSQLEELGTAQFNLLLVQIKELKAIKMLLITGGIFVPEGTFTLSQLKEQLKKFRETPRSLFVTGTKEPNQDIVDKLSLSNVEVEIIHHEQEEKTVKKNEVDFDALINS